MNVLITVVLVMAAAWLVWKTMSLGLRLVGWALIAIAIINAESAGPLTTAVTAGAGVVALIVGHAVFFVRHGYWKPRIIDRLFSGPLVDDLEPDFLPRSRHHRYDP